MAITVGELARLTGVTVRTLHHYDEVGLLRPSARTPAGYRLYTEADVLRLQHVLVLRELGLALDDIAAVLDGGAARADLLRCHRDALIARRGRLDAMIASIDRALALDGEGPAMTSDDLKQLFDGFDPAEHEDEVRERWGDTEAYRESARRTASYGPAEWTRLRDEAAAIGGALVERMRAGAPVDDPEVQALVERHRLHIDTWFYPCSVEMHRQLGQLYVSDPRFTANLDKIAPGYARYLSEAIGASRGT